MEERISERFVEENVDVAVSQNMEETVADMMEQIIDVPAQQRIAKQIDDVPRTRVMKEREREELSVEVLVPQVVENIIEVPKISSQDRTWQRAWEPCRRLNAGRRLSSRITGRRGESCIAGTDSAFRRFWNEARTS